MIHHIPSADQLALSKFSRFFGPDEWNFHSPLSNNNVGRRSLQTYFNLGTFFNSPRGHRTWGGSANRCKRRAAFGAMGEALERGCLSSIRANIADQTYDELIKTGHAVLDPTTYRHYADDQDVLIQGEVQNIARNTRLPWTWFEDAIKRERTLLPSFVNSPYPGRKPVYFGGTTSGNGCGQDSFQAQCSGVFELLERDAILFYWWTRNSPRQIDFTDTDDRWRAVLRPYEDLLPSIDIFWVQTDFNLYTVFVTLRGQLAKRSPRFSVSGAARLDPLVAIDRALSEMVTLYQHFESSFEAHQRVEYGPDYDLTVWDFIDHVHLYAYEEMQEAYKFLFPETPVKIHWSELPNLSTGSAEGDLEYVISEFKRNGHRLYFRDLATKPLSETGLHVYRAYSPDLIEVDQGHKYRALGTPRFYNLPKKLKLKQQPVSSKEMNPYPHPFP